MGLYKSLRYITRHPLNREHRARAVGRFVRWQLGSRLIGRAKAAVPFVGPTRLLMSRGMHAGTGNYYCGLHEFEDMALVLHALRCGDLFFDVGANIGSYSILAAGVAGATVVCFEPAPETFPHLMDNIRLNCLDEKVTAYQQAVGEEAGTVRFVTGQESVNHVAADGETGQIVEVPVAPLDEFTSRHGVPMILKVDVEGFEAEVVRGGAATFSSPQLQAVIMELIGTGGRYGHDEQTLQRKLLEEYRFRRCRYEPFERRLIADQDRNADAMNTLLVRDLDFLQERVQAAPKLSINGVTF